MNFSSQKNLILIGPISPPAGGEGVAFQILIDNLKKEKKYNLYIIDKVYRQGTQIRRIINPFRVLIHIVKILNKVKINGIYLTSGQTYGGMIRDTFIVLIGKSYNVPIILHLHGGGIKSLYESKNYFVKKLMKFVYIKLDRIIVLGHSLRSQFSFLPNYNKLIEEVPNAYGKDAPSIKDIYSIYDSSKPRDKLKLLYLSNVLPSKGLFDILEALLMIKNKNIPFEFHFAGTVIGENGQSAEAIQAKINCYKEKFTNEEFIIHGYLTGYEKWKLILSSHIFLLPTSYYFEGQPISIIEAMYGGCCIIATNYRGIPDLVSDGVNGFFVLPKKPDSIFDKLIWLWERPDILKEICIHNHIEACRKYSTDKFLTNLLSIFEKVFN